MNKFPSCRHCNQIIYPINEKNGFCSYCGLEIDEMKNLINEVEMKLDWK